MTLAIFGALWGDEGKGKITDFLAHNFDYVVRTQGGNNAGHIIYLKNEKKTLSLIPSGILNKDTINVITNGTVINPKVLLNEISEFKDINNKIFISDRCHIILPYHMAIEALYEKVRGKNKIGTTLKGIGPAYADKVNRIGIRMCDLIDEEILADKIKNNIYFKNIIFKHYKYELLDFNLILDEYKKYGEQLRKYVTNTSIVLNQALKNNKKILFEGAQGAMLCLEHGTYPFVTSSSPLPSAIPINAGIGPEYIDNKLAIVKSYCTRVGQGFFATEFENSIAKQIREIGHEYGSVTKRPRRIGWLDLIVLLHIKKVTNLNQIALTLIDVLSGLNEIKLCTHYILDQKEIDFIPAGIEEYERCVPVYKIFPGWDVKLTNVQKYEGLPINCRNYIEYIEKYLKIPINIISVGKKRHETIIRGKVF